MKRSVNVLQSCKARQAVHSTALPKLGVWGGGGVRGRAPGAFENREKERERGSDLRRQRLASPTAQVLVAQTTQPVLKNRLRDEF